jgi:hypothetical protein
MPDSAEDVARLVELRVREAVTGLRKGAGEKLVAVLLVGAAADGEPVRRPKVLAVVSDLPTAVLSNLARQTRPDLTESVSVNARISGVDIRLLTEREILRAADVFTLELEDYRVRHRLLHGHDPFTELHFTPGELRRSLEHRARTAIFELRNVLLASEASSVDRGRARQDALGVLELVAFHALRLFGETPSRKRDQLAAALGKRVGIDAGAAFADIDKATDDDVLETLGALEAITAAIDSFGA